MKYRGLRRKPIQVFEISKFPDYLYETLLFLSWFCGKSKKKIL